MMRLFTLAGLFVFLVLQPSIVLAGIITVGPAGSGAAYNDIADAIAAALPGDTIRIAPGEYVDATPLVVDKPLTILGAGSTQTSFQAVAATIPASPLPLLIDGLQAGEEVRIVGLTLSSQAVSGNPASALVVQNCVGPVVLADVVRGPPTPNVATPGLVQVRGSAQVIFDRCQFDAGVSLGETTPGMVIENSVVYINESFIEGGDAAAVGFFPLPPDRGAVGLVATGSEVRLSRSTVRGGDGAGSLLDPTFALASDGAAAILASASQVLIRGGSGNWLVGGKGGLALASGMTAVGNGGFAIEHDATSLISTASDVFLQAGSDGLGVLPSMPVAGAGLWHQVPTPMATIDVNSSQVGLGSAVSLDLAGEAGGLALTYAALSQVSAIHAPGIYGKIIVDPATAVPLLPQTLNVLGEASLTLPIPPLSSLVGITALFQVYTVGTSGTLSLSAPALVAVVR